ncbi:hypothetical protein LEP1GSC165_4061 [Leptospira santarosai str. CBC523]|nr:hypothetical protein LEP1GSC039_1505 [Leptospira santarosai str. 2000027870]EMO12356.1 hypothetical protein LEP1GSC165_4061 [Leptospira santarosai str. CBC523]EPG83410.1 hypothetical protein LEP1GSC048_3479 [Leptospira santarosai serovar Shermani str. 1342KT]
MADRLFHTNTFKIVSIFEGFKKKRRMSSFLPLNLILFIQNFACRNPFGEF